MNSGATSKQSPGLRRAARNLCWTNSRDDVRPAQLRRCWSRIHRDGWMRMTDAINIHSVARRRSSTDTCWRVNRWVVASALRPVTGRVEDRARYRQTVYAAAAAAAPDGCTPNNTPLVRRQCLPLKVDGSWSCDVNQLLGRNGTWHVELIRTT